MSDLDPYCRHDPIQQILGRVRYAGMSWRTVSGALRLSGPVENLTDEHRRDIDTHRSAIVEALESLPPDCPAPHMCYTIGVCCAGTCGQAATHHERKEAA